MSEKPSILSRALQILGRSRTPGRLHNPYPYDVTLTEKPANEEDILMAKSDENAFDFTGIDDGAKNALALSYEAVKDHLDVLPDEQVEFYKSAADALDFDKPADKKKKDDDDKEEDEDDDSDKGKKKDKKDEDMSKSQAIEVIKAAMPDVIAKVQSDAIAPLQVEIKKAQDEITELTTRITADKTRSEVVEIAKSFMPNGDNPSEEKITELTLIRGSMNDDQWKSYVEGQRGVAVQLEKAALFERESHPEAVAATSAYGELKSIADSLIEKSEDKSPDKAFQAAVDQNPVLYERYRKEQAAQAK